MKNLKKYNQPTISATLLVFLMCLGSCKKFVEIPPPINQLTAEITFSSDATANAAITGIYSRMSQSPLVQSMSPYCGMYADEVLNYQSDNRNEFALSSLTTISSATLNSNFWNPSYQYIYFCNSAIEQLSTSSGVSAALKSSLIGEAKFLRAYLYLNLSSLFGDVPLVTLTAYAENATLPRSTRAKILDQVISDLKDAVAVLPETIGAEKIRANRYAALALLARAYLYSGQWQLAAETAGSVIDSKKYSLITDLSKVFLKNSGEAILQFYPTQTNQNTPDGFTYLPANVNETPKYTINSSLMDAFEPGDMRKMVWTASRNFTGQTVYYPAKYKVIGTATLSEYLMVLRLAELYLIRSEARFQLGDIENGIADLNLIRGRARTASTPAVPNPLPDLDQNLSKADALLAVEKERRIELAFEMGHRWLDLKRTGRTTAVIGAAKPSTWSSLATLWPIPQEQLRLNPFLEQNPGYSK